MEIYYSDIRSKVVEAIKSYLSPYLKDTIEAGKEKLQSYVDTKAPYYKPFLASMSDDEKSINPNSTDKSMDLLLHQKMIEKEYQLVEQGHDILAVREGESDDDYAQRTQAYFDNIQSLKQSDLARYVIHRKIILELLKDALARDDNGRYSKEDRIHQIIMPMRTTSDSDNFSDNNLWIVDDDLYSITSWLRIKHLNLCLLQTATLQKGRICSWKTIYMTILRLCRKKIILHLLRCV